MPVSSDTQKRILDLAEGHVDPENGMEKHFLRTLKGEARACTPEEKEWVAYYHTQLNAPRKKKETEAKRLAQEKNENEVQTRKLCVDCSVVIPPERLSAVPNTLRCTKCQSKYPIASVRADEGIAGTREDYHRMRGQVFGGILSRKH
jgi:RNA polymerase-binding transcription factor DksA